MMEKDISLRMRTINEAAEYFKSIDPDTALTKTALRRLVVTGTVKSVRVGNKYLVALESVENYLSGDASSDIAQPMRGLVRAVGR